MPANDGRHGPKSRRAMSKTISAAAAAISALALAACTSTTTGTPLSATPAAVTGAGTSRPAITLTGAGSTFDAPFFNLAFARYQRQNPAVAVSYSSVGSSAGIAAFSARQVNFGASDVPMTAAEQAAARGGASVQVPVDLGAEAVVYHLILPGGGTLHLTGPVIAQIFLGQITSWDDPAIAALNPGAGLPNAQIAVVHRSDGSGTTYIFSNYLSSVDPAWAAKVGTGKTLNWPAGEGVAGNLGVANAVAHIPFAIGYVESSYTTGPALLDAAIRNQAGQYTTPTSVSITAAAAQKPDITPTDFSIVNEPGTTSYPICGYSWALIYTRQASQATGQALVNLLNWLTHAGQSSAATAGYVPLPPQIQQLAHTTLQQVTGPSGNSLTG